jgi:hypothetical protein
MQPFSWQFHESTAIMTSIKHLFALATLAVALPAFAQESTLTEGFDDIGNLTGWELINESVPEGQSWFQGNPAIFPAHSGPPGSYIGANFLSADEGIGSIDNWLITPVMNLIGATTVSFYTQGAVAPGYNDTLEVLFRSGEGSGTAGFSPLLLTIGGVEAYPDGWLRYTAELPLFGTGRFAFHYTGDAATSNYIGIDTVSVVSVPEPTTWLMLALGLGALGLLRRKLSN